MGFQLSPLNKLWLSAFGAVCLLFAAWSFSFSKTRDLFKKIGTNAMTLQQLKDAPNLIAQYHRQAIGAQNQWREAEYSREALFEAINTFSRNHNIQILKFHPEQRLLEHSFELITNRLEVQGAFSELVKLSWEIEQVQRIGHIASSTYAMKEDKRSKQKVLTGNFFIQHYIKN